jgi:hypothetical protein
VTEYEFAVTDFDCAHGFWLDHHRYAQEVLSFAAAPGAARRLVTFFCSAKRK